MSLHIYLLAAVIVAGVCEGNKSESFIFGFKELEACLHQEPLSMNCVDQDCLVKKCLKLGYHYIFKYSSYEKHLQVAQFAHCAFDMCIDGLMESIDRPYTMFSGWTEPILACLKPVSICVQDVPRDEL